jgi:hypothetical protein
VTPAGELTLTLFNEGVVHQAGMDYALKTAGALFSYNFAKEHGVTRAGFM